VKRPEEFAPALERALAAGRLAVIEVFIDRNALTPTMSLPANG
jgi:thiamine pyrophosphate-dependent acetolactate synthase large subunit-like protein